MRYTPPVEVPVSSFRKWLLLVVVLLVVSASAFGAGIAVDRSGALPGSLHAQPDDVSSRFSVFWEAWGLVHDHFVDRSKLDDKTLTYGAVQGMVESLGDTGHTRFLNPQDASFEASDLSGSFEGIGAQLGEKDGYPVIIAPLDGSPAERAGILAGDVIVQVNGQSVAGVSVDKVVGLVRGPKGSSVTLTVIHPGQSALTEVSIQRETIQVHAVTWTMIPGTRVAHLRMSQFTATVNQELISALKEIKGAGAQALVVDVRNNPGGVLEQAVAVTSQFLSSGNVLLEQDADGKRKPTPVSPGGLATDIRMVTLINLGSASAAEIFAGAIQDQKRGQLVGDTSFGTGTVLTPFPLSDGSVLFLGTSEWLTPGGREIWKQGIAPDVRVSLPSGVTPLSPSKEKGMTPEQVQASGDAQLLKAVELLGK